MTELLIEPESSTPSAPELGLRRASLTAARNGGVALALTVAIAGSARPGLGLMLVVIVGLGTLSKIVGVRTLAGRWCLVWAFTSPMLVIRDNSWLAMCFLATAIVVGGLSLAAHGSGQSVIDLAASPIRRREPAPEDWTPSTSLPTGRLGPAVRGIILAVPVVWLFGALLASADQVFAQLVSFDGFSVDSVPFERAGLFLLAAAAIVPVFIAGADKRRGIRGEVTNRLGPVEASIILGSVTALFAVFVVLRSMSLGEQLPDELFRSDVRAGFFQLLWVAALTVMLVLAIRRYGGAAVNTRGVRGLALTSVVLAAIIDALAMIRIGEYVDASFSTPLRFWSFAFGLWLLVVLALTALRLSSLQHARSWFTFAVVSSWMGFVLAMAVVNPDVRIAEHNFANPPTGEEQYISVKPLIWLSDDATSVIVENIDALVPLPNDRYERMVAHLCERDDGSWRDLNLSRAAAEVPLSELCLNSL